MQYLSPLVVVLKIIQYFKACTTRISTLHVSGIRDMCRTGPKPYMPLGPQPTLTGQHRGAHRVRPPKITQKLARLGRFPKPRWQANHTAHEHTAPPDLFLKEPMFIICSIHTVYYKYEYIHVRILGESSGKGNNITPHKANYIK